MSSIKSLGRRFYNPRWWVSMNPRPGFYLSTKDIILESGILFKLTPVNRLSHCDMNGAFGFSLFMKIRSRKSMKYLASSLRKEDFAGSRWCYFSAIWISLKQSFYGNSKTVIARRQFFCPTWQSHTFKLYTTNKNVDCFCHREHFLTMTTVV